MNQSNQCKQHDEDRVYIIECCPEGPDARIETGYIKSVSKSDRSFTVAIYHNDYRKYHVSDYGRWIFSNQAEAEAVLRELPKAGQTVYLLVGRRIREQQVKRLERKEREDNKICINILLMNGEKLSIDDMGRTAFLKAEEE